MVGQVQTYKPDVIDEDKIDRELLQNLNFLLLELRTVSPFFGILATELYIAGAAKNVPTIGVSHRGVVVYNEDFMRSLTPGERIACIVHEALHVALDYWKRFAGQNPKLANMAHDFAINDIIVKSMADLVLVRGRGTNNEKKIALNVKLPANTLWDPKYDGMSGEEILVILRDGVAARSKEIRENLQKLMSDPAAKQAYEREQAINKELRKSLQAAGKIMDKKISQAESKTRAAPGEILRQNREFEQWLRESEGVSYEEYYDKNNRGEAQPEKGQADASADDTNTPASSPGQPNDGQEGESSENGQQSSENNPGQQGVNPYDKARQDMHNGMRDALKDYLDKEKDRISNEYDGTPDGSTREQHLDDMSSDMDKVADDYVGDVTKARENGIEEPQGGNDPGNVGDQESKGSSSEKSDDNTAQSAKGDEGGQGKDPGASKPGQDQSSDQGQGQQSSDANSGQPDGQGSEPRGNPQGSGSGEGSQPGQGGGQSQGTGSGSGGPVSEKQARSDVSNSLDQLKDEISNSLGGQKGGVPGVDNKMASGEDAINDGAYEQALREMGGNDFEGDVDMDCTDIPNNPYSKEEKAQTEQRRREMLQRAVVEDMKQGGQGVGTMPGWMKSEIDGILHPPMRFASELEKFVGPYGAMSKRSFAIRNKRNTFQPSHIIRPGMKKNTAMVYIIMDVSGSMMNGADANNLRHAMGLVQQLAQGLRLEVKVIQNDTGVTRVMNTQEALEEINKAKFEVHGQGGSDLTPAFEMVWKEMAVENGNRGNPIIVFTDGAISVPDQVPRGLKQQVMWVTLPGQRPPTNKWGNHVVMQDL
jgi:predicted metal-dependent peptidase